MAVIIVGWWRSRRTHSEARERGARSGTAAQLTCAISAHSGAPRERVSEQLLDEAGAKPEHLCKLTVYITDVVIKLIPLSFLRTYSRRQHGIDFEALRNKALKAFGKHYWKYDLFLFVTFFWQAVSRIPTSGPGAARLRASTAGSRWS